MAKVALVLVLGVALVAMGATLLIRELTTTSAETSSAQMALNVSAGGTCDDATEPTKCDVPLSGTFTLDVNVLSIPSAGHIGMQTFVDYGSLIYKPTAAANDEIAISTCGYPGIAVRSPGTPIGDEGTVAHGITAGFPPVFTTCFDGGTIVSLSMNCTATNSAHDIDLVPIPEDLIGAGFKPPPPGVDIPAKVSVRPMVINCTAPLDTPTNTVVLATDTPTNTATPAQDTATPTASGTPVPAATNTPVPPPTSTPPPACVDDSLEENDTRFGASPVTLPLSRHGLRSCPNDDDWFAFPGKLGEEIQVDAFFLHAEGGDIDIALHDPSGFPVEVSDSVTNGEKITFTATSGGTYTVRVYMSEDLGAVVGNTYTLAINVEPADVAGDVDCNDEVTSGDALLILQLNVGFIADLACIKNADVNCDFVINPVDAALILQFEVGLLSELPACGSGVVSTATAS